ncbi:MAG: DUF1016 N-terminal domain-containing protein [Nitrosomonadales bacterium]
MSTPNPVMPNPDSPFSEIVRLIESARQRACQAVNTTLIELYWNVGEYISQKIETDAWGKGTVKALAVLRPTEK